MPRSNRFHPYNRQKTAQPAIMPQPAVISPSYSPDSPLQHSPPLPSIDEHSAIESLYPIRPDYITGITSDGKLLVARSILQSPDGTFLVQMETARFPSEIKTQDDFQLQTQSTTFDATFRPSNLEVQRQAAGFYGNDESFGRRDSGSVQGAPFPKSNKVFDDECAVVSGSESGDEDALGELDEDLQLQAVLGQGELMLDDVGGSLCRPIHN